MRGKASGILYEIPKERVNAATVVEKLLEQMMDAVERGNVPKYESLSDQLAVFSRAYVVPSIETKWDEYRLTRAETIIAELLHSKLNETVRRDSMMNAIYFSRPDEEPEIKIIDIFICKIRRKLANSPYRILNVWGQGYCMVNADSPRQNDRNMNRKGAA